MIAEGLGALGLAVTVFVAALPLKRGNLKKTGFGAAAALTVLGVVLLFLPAREQSADQKPPRPIIYSRGDQDNQNNVYENNGGAPLVGTDGKLKFKGNRVYSGSIEIPPPSGKLSKLTRDEFYTHSLALSREISAYEIASEKDSPEARQSYYTAHFATRVSEVIAEMNARAPGGVTVPRPDLESVRQGRMVAVTGMLAGPYPLSALLRFIRSAAIQTFDTVPK